MREKGREWKNKHHNKKMAYRSVWHGFCVWLSLDIFSSYFILDILQRRAFNAAISEEKPLESATNPVFIVFD